MARINRTYCLIENGYYHVTSRGVNKQDIFIDEKDYNFFKECLIHYKKKYGAKLLAYTLMPNHFHLLVKSGTNLPLFIGYLKGKYAQYFNYKYSRTGHLYERRYFSLIVGDDPQLISLARYIHANPVRAGLVDDIINYPHTSAVEYIHGGKTIDIKEVRRLFVKGTPLTLITS